MKQHVSSRVTLSVVHGLEPVHVHVGGPKAGAFSASAFHLVLQLFESDSASPGAGQFVGRCMLPVVGRLFAVTRRLLAISCRLLPVPRRPCAVAGRANPDLMRTRT